MFYNEVFVLRQLMGVIKNLSVNDSEFLLEFFLFLIKKMNFFLLKKTEMRRFFEIVKKKNSKVFDGMELFFLFDFFDVLLKNENCENRIVYNYFLYVLFFLLNRVGIGFCLCKVARQQNFEKENFIKEFLLENGIRHKDIVFSILDESIICGAQIYFTNCERYEFNYRRYINDTVVKIKNLFFEDF
jgi:hypothetical protein